MSGVTEFVSSEFDIFARKPVQTAIRKTKVLQYKTIASVDKSDIDFSITEDHDMYIDLDIKLLVRGKLIEADAKDLDATDFTAGTNNFLIFLFSQCSISLNGVNITPATELYHYRAYLETYGSDAANTHRRLLYGIQILVTFWPVTPRPRNPRTKSSLRVGIDRHRAK
jgi:hypothetical protein